MTTPLAAINPLPWILDSQRGYHLDVESLREAYPTVASAGFTSVQTDIPADMTVDSYRRMVSEYQLSPGPAYFAVEGHESVAASAMQADKLRQLDVDLVFVAAAIAPERFARPGVGADFRDERLADLIGVLTEVAGVFSSHGITAALHPHVGTWIETEQETRTVLAEVSADLLRFGPDTGHLAWAGMDPAAIIGEFRDRVAGAHIKDVDLASRDASLAAGVDYFTATEQFRLWREPGLGDLPVDRIVTALAAAHCPWVVIEVDVPWVGSAEESAKQCAEYVSANPYLRLTART